MTDIRQLIHQSIEIEGLLKVLLDRNDDLHAADVLAGRFEAFVQDMNSFIQDLRAGKSSSDPDLEEVKDQEAEEPEVVPETEAATHALVEGAHQEEEIVAEAIAEPKLESEEVAQERREMPPLRTALTLNDKFYFIREVFDGNEKDFNDTLEVLDGMDSYVEAEDYITGDMMLDGNAPGVRAFLDFLSKNMNP